MESRPQSANPRRPAAPPPVPAPGLSEPQIPAPRFRKLDDSQEGRQLRQEIHEMKASMRNLEAGLEVFFADNRKSKEAMNRRLLALTNEIQHRRGAASG